MSERSWGEAGGGEGGHIKEQGWTVQRSEWKGQTWGCGLILAYYGRNVWVPAA